MTGKAMPAGLARFRSGLMSDHQSSGSAGRSPRPHGYEPIRASTTDGPRLLCTGEQAARAAGLLLQHSRPLTTPSTFGPVCLVPGSRWRGDRMLLEAAPLYVRYGVGDRLYEWSTHKFIANEWYGALSDAAESARHWEAVAKVQVALVSGLFFPWYVTLGLSLAKISYAGITHADKIGRAYDLLGKARSLLQQLKERNPKLYDLLLRRVASEFVRSIPTGANAEDAAFLIGRVVRGAASLPSLTLAAFVRMLSVTTATIPPL